MKAGILSAVILLGLYSLLSLLFQEREAVRRSLSFFFSVSLVFLIFSPLLSGDIFRPLEDWKNEVSEGEAVGEGDSYFQKTTEDAVTEAFLSHLAERFSLPREELMMTAVYNEALVPTKAVLTLSGGSAFSDLISIEAYGKKNFCESFEVTIHVG